MPVVYITGIPLAISDDILLNIFGKYGEILQFKREDDTACFTYPASTNVNLIVFKLNGSTIEGYPIKVSRVRPLQKQVNYVSPFHPSGTWTPRGEIEVTGFPEGTPYAEAINVLSKPGHLLGIEYMGDDNWLAIYDTYDNAIQAANYIHAKPFHRSVLAVSDGVKPR